MKTAEELISEFDTMDENHKKGNLSMWRWSKDEDAQHKEILKALEIIEGRDGNEV